MFLPDTIIIQLKQLLAAAVVANLLSSATSAGFAFYKLSLIWATSHCNIRGFDCVQPIPNHFTIHGLWPEFANDTEVPSYDQDNTCTSVTATPPEDILDPLQPLKAKLNEMWPNLVSLGYDYFWEEEWRKHVMCSDYPNRPYNYFNDTLTLANIYHIFEVMGIQPGADNIQGKEVLENVKRVVGVYPQIACNIFNSGPDKILQLWEFRFCFGTGCMPPNLY